MTIEDRQFIKDELARFATREELDARLTLLSEGLEAKIESEVGKLALATQQEFERVWREFGYVHERLDVLTAKVMR